MYDDTDAIPLYMLAGPDSVRLTEEFERVQALHNSPLDIMRKHRLYDDVSSKMLRTSRM